MMISDDDFWLKSWWKRVFANRDRNGDTFWSENIIRMKNGFGGRKGNCDDFLWKATYIDEKWFLTNKDRFSDDFW